MVVVACAIPVLDSNAGGDKQTSKQFNQLDLEIKGYKESC